MQPKEAHYQSDDRRSTADRNDLPRQPNCAEASDSSFNSKRSIGNDGPSNPRASSGTSRIHHLHPIEKRTPHHQIHRTSKHNRVPPMWFPFVKSSCGASCASHGSPRLWSSRNGEASKVRTDWWSSVGIQSVLDGATWQSKRPEQSIPNRKHR